MKKDKPRFAPKQKEILKLVSKGFNTSEVARQVQLEETTVRLYLSQAYPYFNIPPEFDPRSWLVLNQKLVGGT